MTRAMARLSGGETSIAVPAAERVGEMAKAAQVFKDSMLEAEHVRSEQAATKARTEAREASDHERDGRCLRAHRQGRGGRCRRRLHANAHPAQTLTGTAEKASQQSMTGFGQCPKVAGASEELTASVGEIGRLVEQSTKSPARPSSRPIGQARRSTGWRARRSASARW
jgi:methyl-accepting chemotaxis protein